MQPTGTLKKRRRPNIAKLNGLFSYQYDETEDTFIGRDIFASTENEKLADSSYFRRGTSTYGNNASGSILSSKRITRDPRFHQDLFFENDVESNTGIPNNTVHTRNGADDRSHFLDRNTMQRLKQIIWYGASGGTFPWKWNAKSCQIDKWSPGLEKVWLFSWYFFFIQTVFLTGYQIYAFWDIVSSGEKSNREIFMSFDVIEISLMAIDFAVNMFFYRDQIRQYINTLLKFNREHVSKYVIDLNDYPDDGRLVINLSSFLNFSQVPVLTIFFIAMPFVRWYMFSYIYPKPWYWLIPGTIQQYCFAVQMIISHVLITWLVVAHTNTINFWLQEIHNHNDTECTSNDIRAPKTSIEMYKSLQILNQYFNDCVAPLYIPMVMVHLLCIIVTCGYIMIRCMNHLFLDEFPQILTYPAGFFGFVADGFVVLSMAAQLNDLSSSFIDSWSLTKQKDFRRILMSCPTLRIRVGRFYFITVATTITFFKVLWEFVTDAIIAFP